MLERTKAQAAELYASYNLGEAAKLIYEFAWNRVCDNYIEWVKPRLSGGDSNSRTAALKVLSTCLLDVLVMLHPLMPHITEELWHALTKADDNEFLALQNWPEPQPELISKVQEYLFSVGISTVSSIRSLRAASDCKPNEKISVSIPAGRDKQWQAFIIRNNEKISRLVGASEILPEAIDGQIIGIVESEKVVGITISPERREKVRQKFEKDLAKKEKEAAGLKARLTNPNFAGKAPPEVVAECQANLAEAEAQAELARKRLVDLG
jgi:valyl-tRNA synthetase